MFLVPRFFVQKGLWWYLAVVFGISLFWIYGFNPVFNRIFLSDFSTSAPNTPLILVFIASFAVRLAIDKLKEEKQREERAKENYQSELSFLRSQISPHFLFNIMNSLVAMSRIKPQLVEPTLIKLSRLMRYMLYESDETKVSIERETEYLESYIELQKIRFGESVNIVFDKHTEGSQCHIEPMLLIPFVENAFKHGVTMINEPEIKIRLTTDNNQLIFDVTNKMNPQNGEIKDDSSGIGLKNVSRRLDLLYPKAHSLAIDTEGGLFSVHLTIFLTKLNS